MALAIHVGLLQRFGLLKMKTKNTSCQWRDSATLPRSNDWSWDYKKAKRARIKSLVKSTKKVETKRIPIKAKPAKIVSTVTLESLGLQFTPTTQLKASIV
jgi:hypothetical protein